ncbi:hypothetical protein [Sphingomonas sp. PB4P5]|uniref:hypothetical protein n=1 Tax=Parasphingomonas puruogangriensis TaxID=3096155 RepID=UPI002FC8763A
MTKIVMGQDEHRTTQGAHWQRHGGTAATPQGMAHAPLAGAPIELLHRRRFVGASPPPATDAWQAVPEWATWLMLLLGLSIVALLLGAIVYLLG